MFDEDLSDFFDTDDFAEVVTVNGKTLNAIFDRPYIQHNDGFSVVASHVPQLTCQSVDITNAEAAQGSNVVVRAKQYVIAHVEDDGTGISTVFLHEKN